jgi:hypothetical protein
MPSPREWITNNPAVATVVAVLVLVGALLLLVWQSEKPNPGNELSGGARQVWFYDLGTGQKFPGATTNLPPFKTDSGPENGVRAWVFACGDCKNEQFVAFLEKFTDEAKRVLTAPPSPPPTGSPRPPNGPPPMPRGPNLAVDKAYREGRLVANPSTPDAWYKYGSPEGKQILAERDKRCDGKGEPTPCMPPNK